jgi:GAF domain-containing protein
MTASAALETFLAIEPRSNEEQVLRLLIELGAQFVGASEGSLLVHDPRANDLVFAMTVGGDERVLVGQRVPMSKGLTGLAAATLEVQIGAPTFSGIRQVAGQDGADGASTSASVAGEAGEKLDARAPESVIAAPMLVGDELVGVITAVTFEPGKRFTSDQGELYARIAAVAGVVVELRQKLAAISAMRGGAGIETAEGAEGDAPGPTADGTARDVERSPERSPERTIAEVVGRLSRRAPHLLGHVARILVELEGAVTGVGG